MVGPFRPGSGVICHSVALGRNLLQRSPVRTIHIPAKASNGRRLLNWNAFNNTTSLVASPFRPALLFLSQSNDCALNYSPIRRFSLLTRPPVFRWASNGREDRRKMAYTYGGFHRQFHSSLSQPYDRLQNLEDAANRDRDNANAQAVFLQVRAPFIMGLMHKALLDKHPDYVVKRYESGGVATNAECDSIYTQALDKLARRPASSYRYRSDSRIPDNPTAPSRPNVDVQRLSMSQDNARQVFAGMKGNPVHVVVDEGTVY